MTEMTPSGLTEDQLDILVSIAIRRAEILDDLQSPMADEAWREVMVYEEQLAGITSPTGMPGGIARVGAVRAALAGGFRADADRLARQYLAEALSAERRQAMGRAFQEDQERLARHYPALAETGRLEELRVWRAAATAAKSHVFPRAA